MAHRRDPVSGALIEEPSSDDLQKDIQSLQVDCDHQFLQLQSLSCLVLKLQSDIQKLTGQVEDQENLLEVLLIKFEDLYDSVILVIRALARRATHEFVLKFGKQRL